jgi:phosphate transport system substrate-binding protein
MRRSLKVSAALAALSIVAAACGSSGGSGSNPGSGSFKGAALTGAGSTFAQPMYSEWASGFTKVEADAKVNYQAIGSGGGVEQFTAKTVDFGATDVPLQSEEISAVKGDWVEFPTALGGVAIVYNVQGVQAGLKLDGPTVGDIFAQKVKAWNDPEIAGQNPGVTLPNTPITPVVRAEDSGTTAVFSGWLGKESSEWAGKASKSSTIFPSGVQKANGNSGVAAGVKQSNGTVGYVSYDFAVTAGLSTAQIKAPDGTYVAPSLQSITAAGGGLHFPITPDTNILDSSARGAYPIASTTYVLIYTDQTNEAKAQTLVDFWHWALTKGQSETNTVNYAPLPSSVAQGSLAQLAKITDAGTPVKPSANA